MALILATVFFAFQVYCDFNAYSLDNNKLYNVAVIDYVFTSPYYEEFVGKEFTDTDILLRDILLEYLDNLF